MPTGNMSSDTPSDTQLQFYGESIPEDEMDQVPGIGGIKAQLFREERPDHLGQPESQVYTVYNDIALTTIPMPLNRKDIITCEQLARELRIIGRRDEAEMVQNIDLQAKQAILDVTATCTNSFANVQKVFSETPQNQGGAALNEYKKQTTTTTEKSAERRERAGRKHNLFNNISNSNQGITGEACDILKDGQNLSESESELENPEQQEIRMRQRIDKNRKLIKGANNKFFKSFLNKLCAVSTSQSSSSFSQQQTGVTTEAKDEAQKNEPITIETTAINAQTQERVQEPDVDDEV